MEDEVEVGQDGEVEAEMGVWNLCGSPEEEWRIVGVDEIGDNEDEVSEKDTSGAAVVGRFFELGATCSLAQILWRS